MALAGVIEHGAGSQPFGASSPDGTSDGHIAFSDAQVEHPRSLPEELQIPLSDAAGPPTSERFRHCYISFVPQSCQVKDLEVAFSVYGAVRSVIIKPDLHRYAVRHAFIAFEEPEAAQLAVQENDAHVMDEWGLPFKLHLEWAKSDGKKRGRKGARRTDGMTPGDKTPTQIDWGGMTPLQNLDVSFIDTTFA
jgi:hypothetical protein